MSTDPISYMEIQNPKGENMAARDEDVYDLGISPDDLRHSQHSSGSGGEQLVNITDERYEYVGDLGLFDTSVPGVIALNGGLEASKGPGIVIKDIATAPIKMMWTDSLTGCIALSMTGINKETGKKDAFFAHMRHWDSAHAEDEDGNPMKLAKQFVESHRDIRLHWGTDFFFGKRGDVAAGMAERNLAQRLLSHKLGFWVRDGDCVVSKIHTFIPSHEVVYPNKPAEANDTMLREAKRGRLQKRIEHGEAKKTKRFEPDVDVLGRLRIKREAIRIQLHATISNPFLASRRRNKIEVLDRVIKAYESGNLDDLCLFARHAEAGTSPYTNHDISNAWNAVGESETVRLTLEAYESAKTITMESNELHGGLKPDGTPYVSDDDYASRRPIGGAGAAAAARAE